jgi:type I restriction enzyme R subunit
VESWEAYLIEHRDEITAIQLLTEAKERRIAFADVQAARRPDQQAAAQLDPDLMWQRVRSHRRRDRSGTATGTP